MPAVKRTAQYKVVVPAASDTPEASIRFAPGNPGRSLLMLQNTGANDLLIHFGEKVQGDGSDILFTAGSGLLFDRGLDTVPEDAISVGSLLGSTLLVVEQITVASK